MMPHYPAMVTGHLLALAGWLVISRGFSRRKIDLWDRREDPHFERPWLEFGLALLALVGVLVIGQIWLRGWLLPETGLWAVIGSTINQVLIFLPMPLLVVLRRNSMQSMWLPRDRVWLRLGTGVGLAMVLLMVYGVLRTGAAPPVAQMGYVAAPGSLYLLAQVFMEDISIAIVLVRQAAALGGRWRAVVLTGALFAAGHIPTMVAKGVELAGFGQLLLDACLAMAVIAVLQRARDIWWFWPVHYVMDMMQFLELPPA